MAASGVTPGPDAVRRHWACFVERALRDAHNRGMTTTDVEQATGIGSSTLYRWQAGDGGLPQLDKVISFCVGLGLSSEVAFGAFGLSTAEPPAPEPPPDPDLQRIGRLLNNPNVPAAEKAAVRHTLRMLSRGARSTHEPGTTGKDGVS